MKDYYRELIHFAPSPIKQYEREKLRELWKNEVYPCLGEFLDFYECFQYSQDIRTSFFLISPIEEIEIKGGALVFATGHQNAYPLGIELSDLEYENPRVKYQTTENGRWFNECMGLRSFLFTVAGWQIINLLPSVGRIKMNDVKFKKIIGHELFFFTPDRSVSMQSNYRLCRDSEKNILGCYNVLDGGLYLGANADKYLLDYEQKFHVEIDWL